MEKKARVIAYYLPQFHPIPENDEWWGKGFTEWRNVASAKPLFKGHYQPKVPSDLGFYDLRIHDIRMEQAELAKNAGIEGFCYWHYWFGHGRQLLEKPFKEVLENGTPDFPFCVGWANHDWSNKTWEASSRRTKESVLMQQIYDKEDYVKHFNYLAPAFLDDRYIKVDGKPLFVVFAPLDIPDAKEFIFLWQELAKGIGLKGIHFVAIQQNFSASSKSIFNILSRNDKECINQIYEKVFSLGFDAINSRGYQRAEFKIRRIYDFFMRVITRKCLNKISVSKCQMREINEHLYTVEDFNENIYPTLLPNWDRSPRSGRNARIYVGSTPEEFSHQLKKAMNLVKDKSSEHRILFLQSWNEWGEGNYVEPDCKYGHGYLDALRDALKSE